MLNIAISGRIQVILSASNMGALDEGHYHVVLENGVKLDGFEHEPETFAIEADVKPFVKAPESRKELIKNNLKTVEVYRSAIHLEVA
ncbi:hypothetical protein L1987_56934 [Smallanthus sonchifolius]|uniref:Uncharacterized protein n=1 Tax=Smallanthus sonchifolius TaxID=185202 RepID=A0ACB9DBF4_9ASTR|nr:hypothetical protein L1987_56934 [Smallanthus sonchifolius]